ncbi:hypothetical protein N0V82_004283 [Gnomoniopsis sp. IMI 355080]|nr:hypothetical protein N0V82_004283 [Gnomoniopsis sp. IMI 355080]
MAAVIFVLLLHCSVLSKYTRRRVGTAGVIDTDPRIDALGHNSFCDESTDIKILEQGSNEGIACHRTHEPNYSSPALPALVCATENKLRWQKTQQIALHVSDEGRICKFANGSIITVSVEEKTLSHLKVKERQHLQHSLDHTLSVINSFELGIEFRYITAESKQRGIVKLRYRDNASDWFADTQFPQPGVHKYTVNLYSTTFTPRYLPVITNILQHEFSHLLSLRHHPAIPRYSREDGQIVFPAGDNATESIMGWWAHPGDLYFRHRDIEYLKKFYQMRPGEKIGDKTIVDVIPQRTA